MKNKIKIFGIVILTIVFLSIFASGAENYSEAIRLISENTACDDLTDEQLEMIGDYYMEQMHPGEAHEYMDRMMGGEGSESLKRIHISMAYRLYCGNTAYGGYGMMNWGMMGNSYLGGGYPSMMGSNYGAYGSGMMFVGWIIIALVVVVLVLLIIWLIKQLTNQKRRRYK